MPLLRRAHRRDSPHKSVRYPVRYTLTLRSAARSYESLLHRPFDDTAQVNMSSVRSNVGGLIAVVHAHALLGIFQEDSAAAVATPRVVPGHTKDGVGSWHAWKSVSAGKWRDLDMVESVLLLVDELFQRPGAPGVGSVPLNALCPDEGMKVSSSKASVMLSQDGVLKTVGPSSWYRSMWDMNMAIIMEETIGPGRVSSSVLRHCCARLVTMFPWYIEGDTSYESRIACAVLRLVDVARLRKDDASKEKHSTHEKYGLVSANTYAASVEPWRCQELHQAYAGTAILLAARVRSLRDFSRMVERCRGGIVTPKPYDFLETDEWAETVRSSGLSLLPKHVGSAESEMRRTMIRSFATLDRCAAPPLCASALFYEGLMDTMDRNLATLVR